MSFTAMVSTTFIKFLGFITTRAEGKGSLIRAAQDKLLKMMERVQKVGM